MDDHTAVESGGGGDSRAAAGTVLVLVAFTVGEAQRGVASTQEDPRNQSGSSEYPSARPP